MPKFARRRPVVIAGIATLLLSGTAVALASTGRTGISYRTTTVKRGDVDQLLNLTGTISVVNHASAGFAVAGTVATVNVHVGDTVKAGQTLATLATAPLIDAVTQAVAQLAQAQDTLQTDQTTTTSSTPSATTATATPPPTKAATTSSPTTGGGRTTGRSAGTSTTAAQRALGQAQARATQAMTQAARAVAATESACGGAVTPDPSPSPTGMASSTPNPAMTPSVTPSMTPLSGRGATSCPSAEQAALTALQAAAHAQQAVSSAQQALSSAAAATPTSTGSTAPSTRSTVGSASTSTQNGSRGSSTLTSSSRSTAGQSSQSPAARITLDQAAIVTAQAALDTARRNLADATLTSPLSGTIAQQPFSISTAEAPGTTISILGRGAVEITANIPATALSLVKLGQPASVIANGSTTPAAGSVTAIGLLPVSTSSTSAYPVTVLVPQPSRAFVAGASASVMVVVKTVTAVVTVPNSAVTLNRGRAYVNLLTSGKPTRTAVQVGAIGALLTQVTSGVSLGQVLVLADPTQTLPASSATLPTVRQFGPGGGGGGGFGRGSRPGGNGQAPPAGGPPFGG